MCVYCVYMLNMYAYTYICIYHILSKNSSGSGSENIRVSIRIGEAAKSRPGEYIEYV